MIYDHILSAILGHVNTLLDHYTQTGYTSLVQMLRVPLASALTLYIIIMGISITQGWVQLSISNFVKSAIKIGLIYTFAMNWGNFNLYIVNGIEKAATQLGANLINISSFNLHGSLTLYDALQHVLTQFAKIGLDSWRAGSWRMITPYFTALIIWGAGFSMVAVGFFQILLAKVMLTVLFVVAPLFVGFTMFKSTHGLFDRWVGMIVGYIFLTLFVSLVLGLMIDLTNNIIQQMNIGSRVIQTLDFIPIVFLSMIGIGLIHRISSMSSMIGSGFSSMSASMLSSGKFGAMMGGVRQFGGDFNRKSSAPSSSAKMNGIRMGLSQAKEEL